MYATLTRTKSGISSSAALLTCLGFGSAMAIGNRLLQKTKNCMFSQLLSSSSFNCSPCFSVLSSLSFNCSLSQLLYFDASKSTFKDV
ncbi:unnamed protein product [Sphagnum troendelagicum]